MRAAVGHLYRALWWTGVLFVLLLAAWVGSEARHPGRQYPPAGPACLFLALLFGPAFYIAWRAITRGRRAKKAGR